MAKSCSYGLGLACFAIAVAMAGATRFQVGGAHGWSVPAAGAESFNAWATKNRFQVGDTLEFVYPSDQDSVLLVDPADYNACNTSSYVKKFTDGDTMVTLDRAGAFFFISGVEANCRANEKVIVMVLAGGRNGTGGAPAPSSSAPPPPPPPPASPPPPANATPPAASSSPPAPTPPAASPPSSTSAPPPPAAAAPTTTPSTPPPTSSPPPPPKPSSAAPASAPPSAPTGTPQPPPPSSSASSPAPSAQKPGKKSPPPGSKSNDRNGAALTVAASLASSLGASVLGYAMLAL